MFPAKRNKIKLFIISCIGGLLKDAKRIKGNLLLLLTSIIWGCAFVAQRVGMDHIGPFTFQAVRTVIAGFVLIPVFMISDRIKKKKGVYNKMTKSDRKSLVLGGVLCGIALCGATNFQQVGLLKTSVGKAGFITALYIVIVPLLGFFIGKKVKIHNIVCVIVALAGLYLLCIGEGFRISASDFYIFLCALIFSGHILIVDHFVQKVDPVKMSCIQMFVAGGLSALLMLAFEEPKISMIADAYIPLLYAGVLSSGVAYTLQIVGQKSTSPTTASMILSLEAVFSLLSGAIILSQIPTLKEVAGCFLMFLAIIFSLLLDEYSPKTLAANLFKRIPSKRDSFQKRQ